MQGGIDKAVSKDGRWFPRSASHSYDGRRVERKHARQVHHHLLAGLGMPSRVMELAPQAVAIIMAAPSLHSHT